MQYQKFEDQDNELSQSFKTSSQKLTSKTRQTTESSKWKNTRAITIDTAENTEFAKTLNQNEHERSLILKEMSTTQEVFSHLPKKFDLEEAWIHHQSQRIAKPPNDPDSVRCPCCDYPAQSEKYTMGAELQELSEVGSSIPLFFTFFRGAILLMLVLFITSGFWNLLLNLQGNYCSDSVEKTDLIFSCQRSLVTVLSLANVLKDGWNNEYRMEKALNFFCILVCIVVVELLIIHIRRRRSVFEENHPRPSDYVIRISGIPRRSRPGLEQEIKELFQHKYEVVKVCIAYDVETYVKLIRNWKRTLSKSLDDSNSHKAKLRTQATLVGDEVKTLTGDQIRAKTTGEAFITFQRKEHAELAFLRHQARFFKTFGKNKFMLSGHPINIQRASDPTDILWEHLSVPQARRTYRKGVTFLVGAAIIAVTSRCVFLLTKHKNLLRTEEKDFYTRVIVLGIPLLTFLMNMVMKKLLLWLAAYEEPATYTEYNQSVTSNLVFYKLINSIVVSVVYHMQTRNYFGRFGLLYLLQALTVTNSLLIPVSQLVDLKYMKRAVIRLRFRTWPPKNLVNQEDLNKKFEDPEINFGHHYSEVLNLVFFGAFYSSLLPFASLTIGLGLIILYYVMKYNFLHRRSFPKELSGDLALKHTIFFKLAIFAFALSNLVLDYLFVVQNHTLRHFARSSLPLVGFIFAGVYLLIPLEFGNKRQSEKELKRSLNKQSKTPLYDEVKSKFRHDYDKLMPLSRTRELSKIIKREDSRLVDDLQPLVEYALSKKPLFEAATEERFRDEKAKDRFQKKATVVKNAMTFLSGARRAK